MLKDWDKRFPGRIESMFSALQNVVPSHLADTELFDFVGLERGQNLKHGGDLAFDSETISFSNKCDDDDDSNISISSSNSCGSDNINIGNRKVINILASKPKADS